MIRQILLTAFILFTVCTLWSCNQSDSEEAFPQKNYPELSGQYDLVQRYTNWNGKVTPGKVGYSETIHLTNENVYLEFRNGQKNSERRYYIGKQADSVYLLTFLYDGPNCEDIRLMLQLKNDTLFTRSIWVGDIGAPNESITTCTDCTRSVYVRKKPTVTTASSNL